MVILSQREVTVLLFEHLEEGQDVWHDSSSDALPTLRSWNSRNVLNSRQVVDSYHSSSLFGISGVVQHAETCIFVIFDEQNLSFRLLFRNIVPTRAQEPLIARCVLHMSLTQICICAILRSAY